MTLSNTPGQLDLNDLAGKGNLKLEVIDDPDIKRAKASHTIWKDKILFVVILFVATVISLVVFAFGLYFISSTSSTADQREWGGKVIFLCLGSVLGYLIGKKPGSSD
jgi:heme/copper-type cytochrome/quinol oxidase subunit 2